MRSFMLTLLGSSLFLAPVAAAQQGGAADLCRELQVYAEKKAAEPPKGDSGEGKGEATRVDNRNSGTQGGGSTNHSASSNTAKQDSAAPTAPVSSGAAPEPATSAHATSTGGGGPSGLAGGLTVQQVLETSSRGDRQACREAAQTLRRAGADLPAALIALAAYEPKGQN